MLYKSVLDNDEISYVIENQYPVLFQFLISSDKALLSEIILHPCLDVLKKLIKTKFTKLKEPKNLLILIEKNIPHGSATIVLLINLLRYCSTQSFVIGWMHKIRKKHECYLKNTVFTFFYNFVINDEVKSGFCCEYFVKITPQLEQYIEFFVSVEENHSFYIDLLFEKEILTKDIATNALNHIISLKDDKNLTLLYNSIINHYDCSEYNVNLRDLRNTIANIKDLSIQKYFSIIKRNEPFIGKEFYKIVILQSQLWDGYLQILFWKILIYQYVQFGWKVPFCKKNNEFEYDASLIIGNLHKNDE